MHQTTNLIKSNHIKIHFTEYQNACVDYIKAAYASDCFLFLPSIMVTLLTVLTGFTGVSPYLCDLVLKIFIVLCTFHKLTGSMLLSLYSLEAVQI